MKFRFTSAVACAFVWTLTVTFVLGNEWMVPLAGNTFRSQPTPGGKPFDDQGALNWRDVDEVYSVYFHVDRPGSISLSLMGHAGSGELPIVARVGDETFKARLQGDSPRAYALGEVQVAKAGYIRVDLKSERKLDAATAHINNLLVSSDVSGMSLDYVQSNEGNMFYWGRRGPSVHLAYELPKDTKLIYAYSEITVPMGRDTIGSYFMANGFSEGYFGIQVNSHTERRVLFSVWSPFQTDNPAEIPAEQRIVTLAKGDGVNAQDFGNEGSGGQSYVVYPWQAGVTYRFLTEVKPDGQGNTIYTSWFGDRSSTEWRLIASFRRPMTDKYLTGFHSFLENFAPEYGHIERLALYGNQWVGDVDGNWHEISRAKFTGDNTARSRQRLDYDGGSEGGEFFLRNCGFFDASTTLDQSFQRVSSSQQQPKIDFQQLPRS